MATETRDVAGFDRVELRGIGRMTITQAETAGLVIDGDPDVLPQIVTEVKDQTLVIRFKKTAALFTPGFLEPLEFHVQLPVLRGLTLAGAGTASGGGLKLGDLDVALSGSGAISLGMHAGTVQASIAGAGRMRFAGRAEYLDARLSGAGEYEGADFALKRAKIEIAGAGTATLRVSDALDASVSGAGSVRFYGQPELKQRVSGFGSVKPVGA